MQKIICKTVDEYIMHFPEDVRNALEQLRALIRSAAPEAQEVISYQIPGYKFEGPVVFFAAFENHCSLYVINKQILQQFADELKGFETSGTTIHFTPRKMLPKSLVKKIVKTRLLQNKESMMLKGRKKSNPRSQAK